MSFKTRAFGAALLAACAAGPQAFATDDTAAVSEENGKHFTANGDPTFKIAEDGTVDWYTFSGFRRYHAECHVCHGPDGEGSTYAPPLKTAVMRLEYPEFLAIVAAGRENVDAADNYVMPAFGLNKNVMCYVDDLWVYLRARGAEAIPRGRPAKRAEKPEAYTTAENECMG